MPLSFVVVYLARKSDEQFLEIILISWIKMIFMYKLCCTSFCEFPSFQIFLQGFGSRPFPKSGVMSIV